MDKISAENHLSKLNIIKMNENECPYCHDSGWLMTTRGAVACSCKQKAEIARRKAAFGISPALEKHTFVNFDLRHYADYLQTDQGPSYRILAQKSLDAAKKFSRDVQKGKKPRGILFVGNVGRGKTHLASAIANDLIEHGYSAKFVVVPEFLDALRFSYQKDEVATESDIIRQIQGTPVLILDDLGAHNYSEWTKGKIFTLLNYRLNYQLPTIITTNLVPGEDLDQVIGERTVSRIVEMCDLFYLFSDHDLRDKLRKINRLNPTGETV